MSNALATKFTRSAIWLPAMLLVAAGLLAATGYGSTPSSHAADTGTSTIDVEILPNNTLDIDCDGSGGDAVSETGLTVDSAAELDVGDPCTIEFLSNNHANGIRLRVKSTRPSTPALCQNATRTNACGAVADFDDAATAGVADLGDGEFGIAVVNDDECDDTTWTTGTIYGLPDLGANATICNQVAMSPDGSDPGIYVLQFQVDTTDNQVSGTYYAGAEFSIESI